MRQSKNGLINLINNQGERSDNDASQDQCCFVVFMSFSGDFGVPSVVDWSGGSATDFGASGVAGIFFCLYRILLTVAGQMRSWVSKTSDADQV